VEQKRKRGLQKKIPRLSDQEFSFFNAGDLTTLHGRQDLPDLKPLYLGFSDMQRFPRASWVIPNTSTVGLRLLYEGEKKREVESISPYPKHISTSYAERQNLTMRMLMRRFTRLTNAFSKKVENHAHSVALFAMYYISFASIRRYGPRQRWPPT
jgi:hypothetical protein